MRTLIVAGTTIDTLINPDGKSTALGLALEVDYFADPPFLIYIMHDMRAIFSTSCRALMMGNEMTVRFLVQEMSSYNILPSPRNERGAE